MEVIIIAAQALRGVIGVNGKLPWQRVATDMEFFTKTTMGHTVIMGRATWESIPKKHRPLKGRQNIVVTRNLQFQADDCLIAHSITDALDLAMSTGDEEKVYIVGGAQIYAEAMPFANRAYITTIDVDACPLSDSNQRITYMPPLGEGWGEPVLLGAFNQDDKNAHAGQLFEYVRPTQVDRYPIVTPLNARSPIYQHKLAGILRSKLCPFCFGGETRKSQPFTQINRFWWMTDNYEPIKGSESHMLLVPTRHVLSLEELRDDELLAFREALVALREASGLAGVALYLRQGDPLLTGATVGHIHYQAITPLPGQNVTVSFGQFPK